MYNASMTGNCHDCGVFRKSLHKHHLKARTLGGNDADGVVYICANCHEDRHGGTFGGHKEGLTNSPAAQKKRSKASKAMWRDPEVRHKILEARKLAIENGRRDTAAISRKCAAWWTPERRMAQAAKIREARAKRFWASRGPNANAKISPSIAPSLFASLK
jgi:hypothetical protein